MTADGLHCPDIDPQYQAWPGQQLSGVVAPTPGTATLLLCLYRTPARVLTLSHVVSIRPGIITNHGTMQHSKCLSSLSQTETASHTRLGCIVDTGQTDIFM